MKELKFEGLVEDVKIKKGTIPLMEVKLSTVFSTELWSRLGEPLVDSEVSVVLIPAEKKQGDLFDEGEEEVDYEVVDADDEEPEPLPEEDKGE